jgi:hypothetical protein
MNQTPTQERRTFAGLIRLKMDYIEEAMAFGKRQATLLAEINREEGYNANINTFRVTIWRARQWWRKEWKKRQQGWQMGLTGRAQEKPEPEGQGRSSVPAPERAQRGQGTAEKTQAPGGVKPNLDVDLDQIFKDKAPLLFVKDKK